MTRGGGGQRLFGSEKTQRLPLQTWSCWEEKLDAFRNLRQAVVLLGERPGDGRGRTDSCCRFRNAYRPGDGRDGERCQLPRDKRPLIPAQPATGGCGWQKECIRGILKNSRRNQQGNGSKFKIYFRLFYFWEDLSGLQKVDWKLKLMQKNLVSKLFDVPNLLSTFYFQKILVHT